MLPFNLFTRFVLDADQETNIDDPAEEIGDYNIILNSFRGEIAYCVNI